MSTSISLVVNGADLLADAGGVLFWPARQTLIVADLHLEKGSSLARKGTLLPPFDTRATIDRLRAAVETYMPERVICVGDSFHDMAGAGRLAGEDRADLAALVRRAEWIWIAGNHDPLPPDGLGGTVADTIVDGPLTFRHEAEDGAASGEISGHYHPAARLRVKGRTISGRCFVHDGSRLILPAFGAYTGGLDVRAPDLRRLLARRFEVGLIRDGRIWRIPASELMAPPPAQLAAPFRYRETAR
ncbi:MAG: ligase-associated DNA damage response endonuclease PdeM [Alphaproteobacteria bacterium]|nr:ligase-associated DNA damage response endonuclease PdeM [Alphaproteobacteria bacterium]